MQTLTDSVAFERSIPTAPNILRVLSLIINSNGIHSCHQSNPPVEFPAIQVKIHYIILIPIGVSDGGYECTMKPILDIATLLQDA